METAHLHLCSLPGAHALQGGHCAARAARADGAGGVLLAQVEDGGRLLDADGRQHVEC